jgi:hypothetical protein
VDPITRYHRTKYAVEEKELRKGEILCRALFISVDPITRYRRT